MRECRGTLLRQSSSWTIDWQGPSEESCRTAPRIIELQCRRGKCSQPDFGAFHSSAKVAPGAWAGCASQSGEQPNGWAGPHTMWQLGIPRGGKWRRGVLLRSDVVRSTWAQMIAVASAGGTCGREGRGANAGRGTGGIPYQTP